MNRRLLVIGLIVLIVASFGTMAAQTKPGEFTIVALPDTQFYSKSYPQIFASQTKWIADHATAMNIQLVLGLGDIVDGGGEIGQWQNADSAIRNIEYKVPYMLAIGNHDYDRNNPGGRTASTVNFNNFFGPQRYADRVWYKGHYPANSNENFYGIFQLGGKEYLVLMLEVFPRDSALSWAASIIAAHPSDDVIIVTHSFTYYDNSRMDRCDTNSAATLGAATDNDGEQIWQKLVSKYSNIVLVLSGHVVQGDGTGRRSDLGANGNLVNQILADYQAYTNGGNGYLRILTVKPALNQISVQTYSPYLDKYLTDNHNQFTVPYKNVGLTPALQPISGKVKNVADCKPMSGVSISFEGGATQTDSSGHFEMNAAGPKRYAMTVKRSGYGMAVEPYVTAIPDQPSPGKIFLSTSGVLQGTVRRNAVTLSNASVSISGGGLRISRTLQTDSYGKYRFGWIAVGKYTVTVRAAGLPTATVTADVSTGNTTVLDVSLP